MSTSLEVDHLQSETMVDVNSFYVSYRDLEGNLPNDILKGVLFK